MNKLTFKIEPVAASRPRVTRYGTFYQEPYAQFKKDMAKLLLGRNRPLYAEPLKLEVTFYRTIPKSYSKKKRDEMCNTYCVTKPDLDNFEKALYDALNGTVYVDDSQIVDHHVRKIWVKDEPHIDVTIETLCQEMKVN